MSNDNKYGTKIVDILIPTVTLYYEDPISITLKTDTKETGRINIGFQGFPCCCAIGILGPIKFFDDMYLVDQNYGLDWIRAGNKFFDILDLEQERVMAEIIKKCGKKTIANHYGGASFTLSRRKTEEVVVNKTVEFISRIFETSFEPVFTVRSNHANYPVTQYAAVLRPYRLKKVQAEE